MGGVETRVSALVEPSVKYHPLGMKVLTSLRNPGVGHCLMDSLTGAVSSQKVTEEFKGTLRAVGHRPKSAKVEGCLTARRMCRADWKQGLSDPVDPCGRDIAYQIKATLGITG